MIIQLDVNRVALRKKNLIRGKEGKIKTARWKLIFVFLSCVSTGFGHTLTRHAAKQDEVNSKNYHLGMAARYERMAKEQEWVITVHEEMMVDNGNMAMRSTKIPVGPSRDLEKITQRVEAGMPPNVHSDMKKHCEAIIKDASKLKADYEEFAKWHREQAAATPY